MTSEWDSNDDSTGDGASLYREQSRRRLGLATAGLAAVACAAVTFLYIADRVSATVGWMLGLAAGLATLVSLLLASWLLAKTADERVRAMVVRSGFYGMLFITLGYPTWLVLWMGRVAPGPDEGLMYLLALAVSAGVFLKLRWD